MNKFELDTPALLIDFDKLENNLAAMQKIANDNGVKLRPHTKTHKTPYIAHKQMRAGARGVTVAKLGEAEVMNAAGLDDLLIAFPLQGAAKMERLLRLAERAAVRVSLDSFPVAQAISDAAAARGIKIPFYVEVDTGLHRVGLAPRQATRDFVRAATKLRGIEFIGLLTHAGQAYAAKTLDEIAALGKNEGALMVETAEMLRADGIATPEVSVGSTPTARFAAQVQGVTEIRPGTYVFYDTMQVHKFACVWDDCAQTVLFTVVAKHPDRLIFDGGSKTLSSDRGPDGAATFGTVVGFPHLEIYALSEEHAHVKIIGDGAAPNIGDKVQVIPNHACAVMNLHDQFIATRGDEAIGSFEIAARGKIR
ncbi:MAG: D-threonine aldolase [Anaerolineae bacterium]|nr:D-threonine aldolase [Anaerolineae bacterium]